MHFIQKYEGLYGEQISERSEDFIFLELLETRSRNYNWQIKPHIHPRLYQIFFVESGNFSFIDVKEPKLLKGPCILVIPPTMLHGFEFKEQTRGRIISLADSIIDNVLKNIGVSTPFFDDLQIINSFLENNSLETLKSTLDSIDKELSSEEIAKSAMLESLLQQLFILLFRMWQNEQHSIPGETDHISLKYFRKCQQLIRKAESVSTVKYLAKELGITPVHLNRICNQIIGKPASNLIQKHTIENARKYLLHTSYSISEIAYILNFEYPNYFARFFKKHTGMTPKEFRKKICNKEES